MKEDIYSILKKEHEDVSGKMDKAEKSESKAELEKIKKELTAHMEAEEKEYYPALELIKEIKELTLEAIEEHNVVKILIKQMSDGISNEVLWAKFKVLKENVEHHISEEEGEIFKESKKHISSEDAEEIGKAFLNSKKAMR